MSEFRLLPAAAITHDGTMRQRHSQPVDGRRERSLRTKRRLIAAFIRLVRETRQYPTADEVALVAGCSSRSLFEQFGALRELEVASIDCMLMDHVHVFDQGILKLELEDRSAVFVAKRALLCEKWLPLWRAFARLYGTQESLDRRLTTARKRGRADLQIVFGPELASMPETERPVALMVIDALLDFEPWSRMRELEKMTYTQACLAWASAIKWTLRHRSGIATTTT